MFTIETIYLPLVSYQCGKHVPERSGLNQFNARGRMRNNAEVYIPIPKSIHTRFRGFFPGREQSFWLFLPDGTRLSAKVCQDNGKALMSDPNKALGHWLLREVLNIPPLQLVTLDDLESAQIDSVIIRKRDIYNYEIDIAPWNAYENQ